jgi:hypothetical protein
VIDKPTRPIDGCTCRTVHYHGTRLGYDSPKHNCRCYDCAAARTRYDWHRNGVLEERQATHPEIINPPPPDPPVRSPEWVRMMREGLMDALEKSL